MRIFYAEQQRLHATGQVQYSGQPFITEEVPERAEIILDAVRAAGLGPIVPPADHGLQPLQAVHAPNYLDYLRQAYARTTAHYGNDEPAYGETFRMPGARRRSRHIIALNGQYAFGAGSPITAGTWEAAYWAAQGALSGAAALLNGEGSVYALCRPPGHHAMRSLLGGFCYVNNAAVAARFLQRESGKKVAVLDIDYHHGNGTQEIFYADPQVFFCSLHADPDEEYPYFWGAARERGAGAGKGYNLNLPLPVGTGERDYLPALGKGLEAIRPFEPAYLVVSAGLDIFENDPVGGFKITRAGLAEIGRQIAGLGLPTLIVQEGGYKLDTLGENAVALLAPFQSL